MTGLRLRVDNEFGTLEQVLVDDAAGLCDGVDAARFHRKHGARIDEEAPFHPEAASWDADRVRRQHAAFLAVLEDHGAELVRPDHVPEAIYALFTRDLGFVVGDTFVLGRLGDGVRGREQQGLKAVMDRMGDVVVVDEGVVEGGDVFVDGRTIYVGSTTFSTDATGIEALRRLLAGRGVAVKPVRCARRVLHLDCRFHILGPELALIHGDELHPDDAHDLEQRFEALPVTRSEIDRVGANVLCLNPDEVVVEARETALGERLRQAGKTPIPVAYDEVTKMWGAFRCTTLPLRRAPA